MRIRAAIFALAALGLLSGRAAADSPDAGNGIFRLILEDQQGADGIGVFTVLTGPHHPAGEGHEVLFAGGSHADAYSSYLTIRSDTTGTDYVQTTHGVSSGNLVSALEQHGTVELMNDTGYRTTYSLPGTGNAPDALRVISEVEVTGTDIADSAVNFRVAVMNEGPVPLALAIRYLIDFAPGGDDGPAAHVAGQAIPQPIEQSYGPAPALLTLAPTSEDTSPIAVQVGSEDADTVVVASWHHAFPFAYDYSPAGRDVARACGLNDSAVLVYFSAIALAPGDSEVRTVAITSGDGEGFSGVDSTCPPAPTTPSPTPGPGAPTPVIQPVELPRTGGGVRR